MAAPIIKPVAMALFLISNRFLLSTHVLQFIYVAALLTTKTASRGFLLCALFYGTAVVLLSTSWVKAIEVNSFRRSPLLPPARDEGTV
jgi:hypothetical protein